MLRQHNDRAGHRRAVPQAVIVVGSRRSELDGVRRAAAACVAACETGRAERPHAVRQTAAPSPSHCCACRDRIDGRPRTVVPAHELDARSGADGSNRSATPATPATSATTRPVAVTAGDKARDQDRHDTCVESAHTPSSLVLVTVPNQSGSAREETCEAGLTDDLTKYL